MKHLKTLFIIAILLMITHSGLSAQSIVQTLSNSPAFDAYSANTLTETTAWTTFTRTDIGVISSVSVTFTWETDDYPDEGSLRLRHPDNTISNLIANGVTISGTTIGVNSTNTFTLTTNAFNNKLIAGNWALWIQDAYGDGGHEATSVSVTINYTIPPMTYTSSTTLQLTNSVAPAALNAPVIALQVVMAGLSNPLAATAITFTTTGTTDVSNITNAKVFYTAASAVFNNSIQFGTATISPNGTFTITGNQELSYGNNYFWLTYDVSSTATPGYFLDGTCASIVVGGVTKYPNILDPAGWRKVVAPLAGSYSIGTGNTYTTLRSVLADITSCGLSGNTTLLISSNLTETAQAALGAPASGGQYSLTIRPAPSTQPVITCTHAGQSLYVNGFNNLTIDGSNTIGGTTRDLTFANTNTGNFAHGLYIQGASNFTAKNLVVRNATTNTGVALVLSNVNTGQVHNCYIYKANLGMTVQNSCSEIDITSCTFGNLITGNSLSTGAIKFVAGTDYSASVDGYTIADNIIDGIVYTGATLGFWQSVIDLGDAYNGTIVRNIIKNIVNSTGNNIAFFINSVTATPPNNISTLIANNSVSNFTASTASGLIFGLYAINVSYLSFIHNTINFDVSTIGNYVLSSRIQENCLNFTFNNNILYNNATSTLKILHYIDETQTVNPFVSLNHNLYYLTNGYDFGLFNDSFSSSLSAWTIALGSTTETSDLGSYIKLPIFASVGSPYLEGSTLTDNQYLVPLTSEVTKDINNETRTAENNLAGADIMVPTSISITSGLPSHIVEIYNQEISIQYSTQIASTFQDGIVRTVPLGTLPYMKHTWLFNGSTFPNGQNYYNYYKNTLTISETQPYHTGNYIGRVSLFGATAETDTCFIEIVKVPTPNLLLPANLATNVPLAPVFVWEPAKSAINYILQVSIDDEFSSYVYNNSIADTSYQLSNLNYSTVYYWRVKAVNGTDLSDWSAVRSFETTMQPLTMPTLLTPANLAVNVDPTDADFTWLTVPTADYYYMQVALDSAFSVSVMDIDDITYPTFALNNLQSNTLYYWRVKAVRYSVSGPWSEIWAFTTGSVIITQNLALTSGWNMISSNVVPTNSDMSAIVAPLAGKMQLIKNVYGLTYAPPFQNNLNTWNVSQAYQLRMTASETLPLSGVPVVPELTPITLNQLGWYWLPYYRTTSMAPATALASISNKFLQIKSVQGQVYQPPFTATLTTLVPNAGYMIRMIATDGVLTYPANTITKGSSSDNFSNSEPQIFVREKNITGKTSFIALDLANVMSGDEIGVFTRDGMLVGSSVLSSNNSGVVVWGDDEFTNEKDGAVEGEELVVKIWSNSSKNIGSISQIALNDMTNAKTSFTLAYETDGIHLLKGTAEVSPEAEILVTPQPASSEVFVRINTTTENEVDLKIFSQEGKLSIDTRVSASGGIIKLDTSTLPSGVYQLILNIDGKIQSEKVVIVR